MMIERINDFAARHGGGVGTTAGSFARIGLWAVSFLVALSLVLPSRTVTVSQVTAPAGKTPGRPLLVNPNKNLEPFGLRTPRPNDPVQNLRLSFDDQRAFTKSPFGKDRFRIAWLMGSEGGVFDSAGQSGAGAVISGGEYVPSFVLPMLSQIDGRKTAVDVYWLPAMRTADLYFALLDAIETKPDMIVVSLNPVWVLNPVTAHQWMQLDSKAARQLLTKPGAWPIGAALLSPSDLMWGVSASALGPVRDRWYYGNRIHKAFDDFGPLDRSDFARAQAASKPDQYQTVLAALPANFFLLHRVALKPKAEGWAQLIAVQNNGQNALSKELLRAIAKELRRSKIPSFVYLAQVNSGWLETSKPLQDAMAGLERQLEKFRDDFDAPNIRYQPLTISRSVRRPPRYLKNDVVHMSNAGGLPVYFARELCRLALQVGERARCV